MKGEEAVGVRERIIAACIACIEREGIEALTVRAIAEEARVNVAAINYYFRSKDRLLEEVLDRTLEFGFDAQLRELDEHLAAEGDVRAAVTRFLVDFLRDATHYPRLAVAHCHDALSRQDYEGPMVRRLRAFLEDFYRRVRPALPPGAEEQQRARIAAFWSAIYLNLLMPRLLDGFLPRPIHAPEGADAYAHVLLAQLFGDEGRSG